MNVRTLLGLALPLVTLLGANGAVLAAPAPQEKTLWVSDDVNVTIYNVTLDGTVLSSFHSGSISEVDLGYGADADTLWAAKEGSNLIMQFDQVGNTLASFPGTTYDAAAAAPEGVAVDPADGTLWIVDDVTDLVYHVDTDGTFISSFSPASFDRAATSPQGIAADPTDGTLWLADNVTHSVYNVTQTGTLISSFPASAFGPVTLNLQGIGVDDLDRTLWLTARNTHTIYNVSRAGELISTLDTSIFGSLDPTGVAVEMQQVVSFPDLLTVIEDGAEAGLIAPKAKKKLTGTVNQAQKQFDKGHFTAAASILGGFQEQVEGFIQDGLVDESYGRTLLTSSAYLINSLIGP